MSNLQKCPDCGRMISKRAPSCPECGSPITLQSLPPQQQQQQVVVKTGVGCGTILAIIAALVILPVIGLAMCTGAFVAGVSELAQHMPGMGMLAEMVQVAVRDNPVVMEHVGNIQEIELDLKATAAFGQEDILVFNVKGSKGNGELRVEIAEDQREGEKVNINQGSLRMADGQTFDLFPAGEPEKSK